MIALLTLLVLIALSIGLTFIIIRLWPTQTDRLVERVLTKGDPVRRGFFIGLGILAAFMVWIDPWNLLWFGAALGVGYGIGKVTS